MKPVNVGSTLEEDVLEAVREYTEKGLDGSTYVAVCRKLNALGGSDDDMRKRLDIQSILNKLEREKAIGRRYPSSSASARMATRYLGIYSA